LLSAIIKERFFVTGLADEKLGQKLVLLIEGDANEADVLHKIVSSKLLDKFQVPKKVIVVPQFVESENGKVLRNKTLEIL